MALPHFRNLTSTNTRWEPVYKTLFEINVELPSAISNTGNTQILLENATSIGLDATNKQLQPAQQKFKYSGRKFIQTPSETHTNFEIAFNINQSDDKVIQSWNQMKRWYDLVWNSQTGELQYKHDIISPQITVNVHDRTGEVIRRVDFINCQIKGLDGMDFSWDNQGIIESLTARFVCDYWNDLWFDFEN